MPEWLARPGEKQDMHLPRSRSEPFPAIRYPVENRDEASAGTGGRGGRGDRGQYCGPRLPTLDRKQMFKEQQTLGNDSLTDPYENPPVAARHTLISKRKPISIMSSKWGMAF